MKDRLYNCDEKLVKQLRIIYNTYELKPKLLFGNEMTERYNYTTNRPQKWESYKACETQ